MINKPEEKLAPAGLAILRIALGIVLVVGGWKLAFPADSQALVASYTNQTSGWIANYFVEWIERIGLAVLQFLTLLGWLEMTVGALLIVGFGTPVVAFVAGIMFFTFPIANPVAGMVRLARDVMLGGFALAVAFTGTGAWSLSALRGQVAEFRPEKKHFFLGMIRLATLYALVIAVLFPWGAGASPLNQTMVWWILLPATVLLGLNVRSRWIMALVGLWMLVVVFLGVLRGVGAQGFAGLYWGLDAVKREVGLMAAASVYALLGPDQISFLPRMGHTATQSCRSSDWGGSGRAGIPDRGKGKSSSCHQLTQMPSPKCGAASPISLIISRLVFQPISVRLTSPGERRKPYVGALRRLPTK